ncbi:MBL fold metallo-hydrolase [Myceligenerans cantabricum]
MRLITLGVSGSGPGPGSPASSYLVQVSATEAAAAGYEARDWTVVMDLGNGAFGALQRAVDPFDIDAVAISHLHPDHCADLSGMYVYLRYHPDHGSARAGKGKQLPVWSPSTTAAQAARSYGLSDGETMAADYDFRAWQPEVPVQVGPLTLAAHRVFHPEESWGIRVTGPSTLRPDERAVIAYTGDTDYCQGVVALSRDADLLLSEAAFVEGRDDHVEPGIHLTGRRAGRVAHESGAKRLLLTHLPVWNEPGVTLAEARDVYDGDVRLAQPGATYTV